MSSAEKPKHYSVEEYLDMEEVAQSKNEYIDGWIRAMTGATIRHNCIKLNCLVQLASQLKGQKCRPFDSDTKIRIHRAGRKRFYYPDAQVVCQSNDPLSVFQDHPVLIIEVLSPATRQYDLDEKMNAYLTISSLECYIALEQHQPIAIIQRRSNDGFVKQTIEGLEVCIELPFLDCSLSMREIYEGVEFTDQCIQETDPEYEMIEGS
jgi:Uma2 family endonuclease